MGGIVRHQAGLKLPIAGHQGLLSEPDGKVAGERTAFVDGYPRQPKTTSQCILLDVAFRFILVWTLEWRWGVL